MNEKDNNNNNNNNKSPATLWNSHPGHVMSLVLKISYRSTDNTHKKNPKTHTASRRSWTQSHLGCVFLFFFFLFSHPSPKNSRCSALLSGSPVWILIWMQTHSEDAQRADICAFSLLTFFYFSSPLPPHASTEPRACLSFRGGRVGGFPFFFFVFRTHTHTRAREEDGVSPECLQRSFL